MIDKNEIGQKATELGINVANVERDYVFGWFLSGLYSASKLKDTLVLKGGNCLRKAYLVHTRFSDDLDFTTESELQFDLLHSELDKICDFVQEKSRIEFDKNKNRIDEESLIGIRGRDEERKIFKVRLYFKDFYGNPDSIIIKIRLDITQLDKIYLPVQEKLLIHPYSDSSDCSVLLRCIKLEEILATKLKCLLQRRYSYDLYDLIYSIFINRDIAVNRPEIVTTFLKKTIYEPSPGIAKELLLNLPLEVFRGIWNQYIVCPKFSMIDFDLALINFRQIVQELFGSFTTGFAHFGYFPAELRNPIMESGSSFSLLELVYDGVKRIVEPYSLVYKIRQDGYGQEYFYAYDTTGGRSSGPGIKCFVNNKISSIKCLEDKFTPRYPVELSKAGEHHGDKYFSSSGGRRSVRSSFSGIGGLYASQITYVYECSYCGKRFRRKNNTDLLNSHKDKSGYPCSGRRGYLIETLY
ncbi:MAG: nucleotidyl transferase AbiEii/AbiGii toxin family protein [Candidatus Omnitrophica bacterium]|nr:nucleotidyl transferase AbiEii/AbiGii toxin family protein [Candidatus Omnitrophota bacterium]